MCSACVLTVGNTGLWLLNPIWWWHIMINDIIKDIIDTLKWEHALIDSCIATSIFHSHALGWVHLSNKEMSVLFNTALSLHYHRAYYSWEHRHTVCKRVLQVKGKGLSGRPSLLCILLVVPGLCFYCNTSPALPVTSHNVYSTVQGFSPLRPADQIRTQEKRSALWFIMDALVDTFCPSAFLCRYFWHNKLLFLE